MSPDWADKPEAVPYSTLDNPQSLNLYGYVGNNPLSHADTDGHCCVDDFKADRTDSQRNMAPLNADEKAGMSRAWHESGVGQFIDNHPILSNLAGQAAFVIISGGESDGVAMPKLTEAPVAAPTEGIYEFPDAKAPGKTYVGQSGDVPSRLDQHVQSGKLADGAPAKTTAVPGGKTAREVAETNRIKQLGGKSSEPGSQTSNQRNPVSDRRMEKIKNGSQ